MGPEGREGQQRYSSTLSLTSALDEIVCSTPHSGRFTSGKETRYTVQGAGWAPGPVWAGAENFTPAGIRSIDRIAHSELLYRLSCSDTYLITFSIKYEYLLALCSVGPQCCVIFNNNRIISAMNERRDKSDMEIRQANSGEYSLH